MAMGRAHEFALCAERYGGDNPRDVCLDRSQVAECNRGFGNIALPRVWEDHERVVGKRAKSAVDRTGHTVAEDLNRDDGTDADHETDDRE